MDALTRTEVASKVAKGLEVIDDSVATIKKVVTIENIAKGFGRIGGFAKKVGLKTKAELEKVPEYVKAGFKEESERK